MATMAERFDDGDKGIVPIAKMVYTTRELDFLESGENMYGSYGYDVMTTVKNTFLLFPDGSTLIREMIIDFG